MTALLLLAWVLLSLPAIAAAMLSSRCSRIEEERL